MDDADVARRLKRVPYVHTPVYGVRNQILEVHADRVVIVSERTGNPRPISFESIRRGGPPNRRVILALREALGLE